jgi:hypothetical protein
VNKFAGAVLLSLAASFCQAKESTDAGLANFAKQVSVLADPAHRLESRLIAETLSLDLVKHCEGPVQNRDGDYYACLFTPRGEQSGRFRFAEFSSLSRTPEPDAGGDITWTVDQEAGCLKRESLARAFNRPLVFPRFPSIGEGFLSDQQPEEYNAYDLILQETFSHRENTLIAIFEKRKCVVKIKLYKSENDRS